MKNRAHFAHRIDAWTDDGESIVEHLAGVEDFEVALATYRAARDRWPEAVREKNACLVRGRDDSNHWEPPRASRRPLAGRANTKRRVRGTIESDRPSPPMSARPLPKFTSAKIVRSPLYVLTGSIAISRASPSG